MDGVLRSAVSVDIKGNAVAMEMLPVNNGNGQSYGWILYRKTIEKGGKVKVRGQVRDRTLVIYLFLYFKCFNILFTCHCYYIFVLWHTSAIIC